MYVEKLTMKDFRCFEQAEVTFVYPGKEGLPADALNNVTLLIGINGTGKTSVLKAVALAQLSPIIGSSGFFPRHLVRVSAEKSPVSIARVSTSFPVAERRDEATDEPSISFAVQSFPPYLNPGAEVNVGRVEDGEVIGNHSWISSEFFSFSGMATGLDRPSMTDLSNPFYKERNHRFFLLGYGAMRRNESVEYMDSFRKGSRHVRFQRVAGLFLDDITLTPLSGWYSSIKVDSLQREVRELLNQLLPQGTEFTGEFKDADAIFNHNGVDLPFGALSDGFRSYIGLVADMLYHLNYVCPKKSKLTDLTGIVMIDDIDVHLHPKWQREVVPKLATTFPKLQFIITSHSPLVAGTLHAANIRVVEDNQIHEYTERIHGLNADQILTSSYFMLDSSRSPAAEATLNRIARRVADTHDPAPAIEFLKELAGQTNGSPPKKGKKPAKKK